MESLAPYLLSCVVAGMLAITVVISARSQRGGATGTRTRIGPYLLCDKIGEGATGAVYRALHQDLGRWFALKLLRPGASEGARCQFAREAQRTAGLRHPNTVSVHDTGLAPDGTPYYVMELLEGQTLSQLIEREGPQSPERVISILRQLCGALSEAHGAGLIHRDIKPENIMLCPGDVAKLIDFGLVQESGVRSTTRANALVGTPLFLSPEAIATPEDVSAQADLYGLGAVAYYLLTGSPVFDGTSIVEVCSRHLYAVPVPPSERMDAPIDAELEQLVLSCLAKLPSDRPAGADELAARFEHCLEHCLEHSAESLAQCAPRTNRTAEATAASDRTCLYLVHRAA